MRDDRPVDDHGGGATAVEVDGVDQAQRPGQPCRLRHGQAEVLGAPTVDRDEHSPTLTVDPGDRAGVALHEPSVGKARVSGMDETVSALGDPHVAAPDQDGAAVGDGRAVRRCQRGATALEA